MRHQFSTSQQPHCIGVCACAADVLECSFRSLWNRKCTGNFNSASVLNSFLKCSINEPKLRHLNCINIALPTSSATPRVKRSNGFILEWLSRTQQRQLQCINRHYYKIWFLLLLLFIRSRIFFATHHQLLWHTAKSRFVKNELQLFHAEFEEIRNSTNCPNTIRNRFALHNLISRIQFEIRSTISARRLWQLRTKGRFHQIK